jgi:hypothetical protein
LDGLENTSTNSSSVQNKPAEGGTEQRGGFWSKLSKAAKAQAHRTTDTPIYENTTPDKSIEPNVIPRHPGPQRITDWKPGTDPGTPPKTPGAPPEVPVVPSTGWSIFGQVAARVVGVVGFLLIPHRTSSHDQPIVDYSKLGDKAPKSTPQTQPQPRLNPHDEPDDKKPKPKKPKNFKILLATVPRSSEYPNGHSLVGLTTHKGPVRWYHQGILPRTKDAIFERIEGDALEVMLSLSGVDVLETDISEGNFSRGLAFAQGMTKLPAKPYDRVTNNCVTNCQDVFRAAGFSPEGIFPDNFRAWFKNQGARSSNHQ